MNDGNQIESNIMK